MTRGYIIWFQDLIRKCLDNAGDYVETLRFVIPVVCVTNEREEKVVEQHI